jgi:hypothetical protein
MEPTSNQQFNGVTGAASSTSGLAHSDNVPATETAFSTTAAHATGNNPYPTDSPAPAEASAAGVQGKVNAALESGKKWLNDSGIAEQAQQLPKTAKELGTKAWTNVSGLSNTQKAVGIGLLAAGVAFLATRGRSKSEPEYRDKPRKSPFSKKKEGYAAGRSSERPGQRPWGSSRYGNTASSPAGSGARVSSGSGYSSSAGGHSPASSSGVLGGRGAKASSSPYGSSARRDQGPASGSSYDAKTSGHQNPNNVDQTNSAM